MHHGKAENLCFRMRYDTCCLPRWYKKPKTQVHGLRVLDRYLHTVDIAWWQVKLAWLIMTVPCTSLCLFFLMPFKK